MSNYTIAFDVGGLFIKAAVLNSRGEICRDTVMVYPAKAQEPKDILLAHLVFIIEQQTAKIMDKFYGIQGIGFAFPGPFDYERGICYVRGQSKFDSIYGVNLRQELTRLLRQSRSFRNRMASGFRIVFDNDANLFALGELVIGKAGAYARTMCLTIGTGTGSAFIDQGQLVKDRADVPANGWVYCEPFRGSIIDEHISKRGLLRLAAEQGLDVPGDVKEMADAASAGDRLAQQVFAQFGAMLAEAVRPYLLRFRPDLLVIGGQIAKSGSLFEGTLRAGLAAAVEVEVELEFVDRTSISTFVGVSKLLQVTNLQAQ